MKIKPGVYTCISIVVLLFAPFAYAQQQIEPLDSAKDPRQADIHAALTRDPVTVKQVEEALRDRGYDPGAVDGRWTPETESALTEYQRGQGLEASGLLDQGTLALLGLSGAGAAAGGQLEPGRPNATPDQSGSDTRQSGG